MERKLKLQPSRQVGEMKKMIEEAILDGTIDNTYEDAFEYMLQIKDRLLNKTS